MREWNGCTRWPGGRAVRRRGLRRSICAVLPARRTWSHRVPPRLRPPRPANRRSCWRAGTCAPPTSASAWATRAGAPASCPRVAAAAGPQVLCATPCRLPPASGCWAGRKQQPGARAAAKRFTRTPRTPPCHPRRVPGQLEGELARGSWALAAATPAALDLFAPLAPNERAGPQGGPQGGQGGAQALSAMAAVPPEAAQYEERMWGQLLRCARRAGRRAAAAAAVVAPLPSRSVRLVRTCQPTSCVPPACQPA